MKYHPDVPCEKMHKLRFVVVDKSLKFSLYFTPNNSFASFYFNFVVKINVNEK